MAAALLAALFAMGVFSASGVGADNHSITLSTSTAEPNDVITVNGTGFDGASSASLYLLDAATTGDTTSLGTAVATVPVEGGAFAVSFRIADDVTAGSYLVHAATEASPNLGQSLASKPLTVEVNAKIRSVAPMKINKATTSTNVVVTTFGFSSESGAGVVTITAKDSMDQAIAVGSGNTVAESAASSVGTVTLAVAPVATTAAGMATITASQGTGSNVVEKTAMLEIVAPSIELQVGGSPLMNTDNAIARVIAVKGMDFADGDLMISAQPVSADDSLGDKIDINGDVTDTDVTVTRADPSDTSTITAFQMANGTITIPQGTAPGKIRVTATATADAGTVDGTYTATADFMLNPAAPAQVMNVNVQGGQGVLLVTWTQVAATNTPENRPASTGYRVQWQEIGASAWMEKEITDASIVSTEISGLDHTKNYLVRVAAKAEGTAYGAYSSTTLGSPTGPAVAAPTAMLTVSADSDDVMVFEPGATQTQSRNVSGMTNGTAELNLDFSADSSDDDVVTASSRDMMNTDGDVTGAEVTVTPVGPGTATVTVTADKSDDSMSATTSWDVTVLGVASSTTKADAGVSLEIFARADAEIGGGQNIVITLPGFQIPDSIDRDDVIINGMRTGSYYGPPESISISGSKVTLRVPVRDNDADRSLAKITMGIYQIDFLPEAGLKNPNSTGSKTIVVNDGDEDNHESDVEITPHIAPKPAWVSRGDAVTVTGKGINSDGDATVHLYSNSGAERRPSQTGADLATLQKLGSAKMDGGTATVEIETSSSNLKANAIRATSEADAKGINRIVMVDAGGKIIGDALLGILPTVKLDVSEVRRSGKMEISVSDWYYGDIDRVEVNGILVDLPDNTNEPNDEGSAADPWLSTYDQEVSNNKATFVVYVDRTVRLGEMEVAVYGTTSDRQGSASGQDVHKQTVNVGVFDLSVNPSTAVSDQVIRIEGTGFISNACIETIEVGEQSITEATSRDPVGDVNQCVDTDSNGKLADTFRVPLGLSPGTYTLVVSDVGNRVGEAELVIPKPAIELEPAMGQRGETVTVIGTNFPADDLVTIRYNYGSRSIPVESVITDTVGKWRGTFTVPITAPIGATHEVEAKSVNKGDGTEVDNVQRATLSAKAEHEVPDETLTLSPETVAAGQRLTVVGGNLPLFTPVSVHIGGIAAAGRAIGDDDASDGTGRYEKVILVPQLQPGTHTVVLTAHARNEDISVSRFVEIAPIVTRPTDEVFADLIEAGQLVSVWRYSIDETGSDWDSFDPQFVNEPGINDLELVSTDDIVWIRVTETVTFQGSLLYAGWNLRTLE